MLGTILKYLRAERNKQTKLILTEIKETQAQIRADLLEIKYLLQQSPKK